MPTRVPIFLTPSDAKLLEALWNEHSGAVHSMLLAYCGNPNDAGDILQDLFLRLSRDPSTLATMKSPRAFLIVSARRLAIDLARKRSAELRRQETPEAIDNFHPAPSTPLAEKDLGNIIQAALQKLPPDQRSVVEAKLYHGKTLALIAEEQGLPLNTVASRLRYSLDKLRNELRPHYENMKNPISHSSNSSERLIKPLEPKRVPSVAPGLEGVAAMAIHDFEDNSVFLPPEETSSFGDIETAGCDFGGNAWENLFPTICVELPHDDTENTGEPDIVDPVGIVDPAPEDHSNETPDHSDPIIVVDPDTEDHSNETPDHSDPIIVVDPDTEDHSNETTDSTDSEPEIIYYGGLHGEGTQFGGWINLPPDAVHTMDWVDSDQDGIDDRYQPEDHSSVTLDNPDSDSEVILYNLFDGHDEDSDAHHYLWKMDSDHVRIDPPLPFERVFALGDPTAHLTLNGGTLSLAGDPHFVTSTVVNASTLSLSGDSHIEAQTVVNASTLSLSGTSHFEGQTVVNGGTLVVNEPITAHVQVEQGGRLSVADKSFGEGSYEFSNSILPITIETHADSHTDVSVINSATTASATESHASHAQEHSTSLSANHGRSNFETASQPSVHPVDVSASNSPIESLAMASSSHLAPHEIALMTELDVPTTFHLDSTHADEAGDDIVFVDEAPEAASHEQIEFTESSPLDAPLATQAASTALAGAFVLGSTAQPPSVRGNPSRFSKSL
ncbi:MAG: sigma-70 family RNA polymerase sigma factor [Spartobacteria bacterium]|nr:sigma-70 family RNA polymerase sigma factor [Spartobacteria bacterium]